MTTIRTLPFRIAPVPGEAIDSWLEAYAHRYGVPLREVMARAGINHRWRADWMIKLSTPQVHSLAVATGLHAPRIEAMTLSRYDGVTLDVQDATTRRAPGFRWSRLNRSRYCPTCLAQSGGRWQLGWRLTWSFACVTHRCLLADTCPECGAQQRDKPQPTRRVPQPAQCASNGTFNTAECHADLTKAITTRLQAPQPLIAAQHTINAVIATNHAAFGVYHETPCDARTALTDLSVLAARILAHAGRLGLDPSHPDDLVDTYLGSAPPPAVTWSYHWRPRSRAPNTVVETAVGIAAALNILNQGSLEDAAEAMQWLAPRPVADAARAAGLSWALHASPVLTSIQLKAYAPRLGAALQLRHHAALPTPTASRPDTGAATRIVDRVPAALWPAFSIRLQPPEFWDRCRHLRPALSCAVLLCATQMTKAEAAAALGGVLDAESLNFTLTRLREYPSWPQISIAVAALADYLIAYPSPIDYSRRRRLDYEGLLPTSKWHRMCWATGTLSGGPLGAQVARGALVEEISGGLPPPHVRTIQSTKGRQVFKSRVKDLPLRLTPALAERLREEAARFLARHPHVAEPLTWHPPLSLLEDLDLPNGDVDRITIAELHRAATSPKATAGQIARSLDTDIDIVRYLLSVHPLDRRLQPSRGGAERIPRRSTVPTPRSQ